ncbi:hypothetical protein E1200_31550 [Actinomadura sp. GC306]|uniref:hypothetical protein n=1 Tax=Actinomadura sp. GC306 TaxID=2530367 RepID=UPI001043E1C5|nr:hypothetical protein [Actinomadura sp. GC306]TDC59776.1 hypothetical protein E1200_31550 [Actinomadura sp. GC306]
MSGRRPSLSALDEAVRRRGGMSCGIVHRSGTPVLHVINTESPGRFTEIGADFIAGTWVFTWAPTGDTISPASCPAETAEMIAHALGARP